MTWVKLEDTFTDEPEILAAGDLAGWLYVCGLCYCSKHLTDGFIPTGALARLTGLPTPRKLAALLVEHGKWIEVEGGWRVVDYEAKQRTREQVESTRAAGAVRVKKLRDKRQRNGVTPTEVTRQEVEGEAERDSPPGGAAPRTDDASQPGAQTLVAAYTDAYSVTHGGETPIRPWRDQAGQHAKNLLDAGVPYDDVHACLMAAAKENKSPTVLPHLLADLQHERAQAS